MDPPSSPQPSSPQPSSPRRRWRPTSERWRKQLEKVAHAEKVIKVGIYEFVNDKQFHIAEGSDGTEVFLGLRDDGMEVAIKRVSKSKYEVLRNEENFFYLPALDNDLIVRYLGFVEDENFGYLILQLCESTLEEHIKTISDFEQKKQLAEQVLNSLKILHSQNPPILHRDIKPQNVLIDIQGRAKLCDFGIIRRSKDEGQTTVVTKGAGTRSWRAKETLNENHDDRRVHYKRSTDIQVAGMLMYYILSGGEHPFGKEMRCECNILDGNYNLDRVQDEGKDLIEWMINGDPTKRPTVKECLDHAFFRSDKRKPELRNSPSEEEWTQTSVRPWNTSPHTSPHPELVRSASTPVWFQGSPTSMQPRCTAAAVTQRVGPDGAEGVSGAPTPINAETLEPPQPLLVNRHKTNLPVPAPRQMIPDSTTFIQESQLLQPPSRPDTAAITPSPKGVPRSTATAVTTRVGPPGAEGVSGAPSPINEETPELIDSPPQPRPVNPLKTNPPVPAPRQIIPDSASFIQQQHSQLTPPLPNKAAITPSPKLQVRHFVDKHRKALIQGVTTSVNPILDLLLDEGAITEEGYKIVRSMPTPAEKMRELYGLLNSRKAKDIFRRGLEEHEKLLLDELVCPWSGVVGGADEEHQMNHTRQMIPGIQESLEQRTPPLPDTVAITPSKKCQAAAVTLPGLRGVSGAPSPVSEETLELMDSPPQPRPVNPLRTNLPVPAPQQMIPDSAAFIQQSQPLQLIPPHTSVITPSPKSQDSGGGSSPDEPMDGLRVSPGSAAGGGADEKWKVVLSPDHPHLPEPSPRNPLLKHSGGGSSPDEPMDGLRVSPGSAAGGGADEKWKVVLSPDHPHLPEPSPRNPLLKPPVPEPPGTGNNTNIPVNFHWMTTQ